MMQKAQLSVTVRPLISQSQKSFTTHTLADNPSISHSVNAAAED
jgi:hypothetical protein